MKTVTPLKLEDLSVEQKLGMTMIGGVVPKYFDYTLELIKNHALGAAWVHPTPGGPQREIIQKIKEVADYPIIICCDMEGGYPGKGIGAQAPLGFLDDPDLTFRFSRSFAAMAHEDGFNTICGPVLERVNDVNHNRGVNRLFGSDKEMLARHAAAFIRGFHEAGILSVAKHYPSVSVGNDSHLRETLADFSERDLLEDQLYPYLKLLEEDLLDGIMTQHARLPEIDPEYPCTLSQKVTDILRRQGFKGVYMTDDLNMMGILAKYGKERYALAVAGGNDLLISYDYMTQECFPKLKEDFDKGILSEERLNEAAGRVLAMQEKTLRQPVHPFVTAEDKTLADEINRRSLIVKKNDGLPTGIDPNGHHLFVVMTEYKTDIFSGETNEAYSPQRIVGEIRERFPQSDIRALQHFPEQMEIIDLVHDNLQYDDVVVISHLSPGCYMGVAEFTARARAVFESLQATDRITALLFFGNPFAMESLPPIKRIIFASHASASHYALDVLAGKYEPEGQFPYKINL